MSEPASPTRFGTRARVIALAYVQRDQAEIGNAMALAGGDAAVADGFC